VTPTITPTDTPVLPTPSPTATLPPVDLSVTKGAAGPFFVGYAGGTYVLTVTNVGTLATTGPITIVDVLPDQLAYLYSEGTNWTCGAAGQTVTCTNPGPLLPGQQTTVNLIMFVLGEARPSITNTATVSTPGDSDPNNNSDSEITPVQAGRPAPVPALSPLGLAVALLLLGAIARGALRRRL